jgi:hypothetical protein
MPAAWSNKDERQYKKIRKSNLDRGMGEDRAEEIAARTVNKRRRQEGRTPNKTTQGTGNPQTAYEDRSKQELYNIAKRMKIEGRSSMSKSDLASAIRQQRKS